MESTDPEDETTSSKAVENKEPAIEKPPARPTASMSLGKKVVLGRSRKLPKPEEIVKERAEVEVQEEKEEVFEGNSDFTSEQLREKWNEFLEIKRSSGAMETEMMVLKQPWKLRDHLITVHLMNAVQVDLLQKFQTDLVGHLRRSLSNKNIQVTYEVKEEMREEMLYTNSDKFEHLKKINPALGDLSERLGLDPDF